MNFLHFTLSRQLLATILIALYFVGYGWARSQRILVHRSSYMTVTEGGGKRYFHCVKADDFGGPTAMMRPEVELIAYGCELLFTPLRRVESAFWGVHSYAP